jgi:hypothetical protein
VAIKRKGIVARPGVHHNILSGRDEIVTWEELKEAVQFQNRIPLVLAHPIKGYINPNDRIGTVTQRANEKLKVIEGEFWFFDEPKYWDMIPLHLKKKIIGGAEINLSAGYKVGPIVEGRQTSRQYDHIALDVKNPMFDVGIEEGAVRMESKLPENFRIEETPTIEGTESKKEKETRKEEMPPVTEQDREFWIGYGRNMARLQQLEEANKDSPKPAVEETTEEASPEPEPVPEPEPPKAKTIVPLGSKSKKDEPDEDGQFRIKV